MKIRKIWIKGYHQFKDIYIDLTHPETGEALDKICFIGGNGTGKSTILALIKDMVTKMTFDTNIRASFAFEISINTENLIYFNAYDYKYRSQTALFYDVKVTEQDDWFNIINNYLTHKGDGKMPDWMLEHQKPKQETRWQYMLENGIKFQNNSSDLLVFAPAEGSDSDYAHIMDLPASNVNTALQLSQNRPYYNIVSSQSVEQFWTWLIYLIKAREAEKEVFENKPENLNKTKKALIEEFEKIYPKILDIIDKKWNLILGKAGLIFDVAGARLPVQLNDNLRAYIYAKDTKELVDYNQLSTGIRNFIFRIGHLTALYFNREIKRGIVLMDEPENSLFPDFLYDLVGTYQDCFIDKNGENNTQFFVATHSPIIAAQFQPYERIILDWDAPGSVIARKGVAPIGDDPNDILKKDFNVANLMGIEGLVAWEDYLRAKRKLRETTDEQEKDKLNRKISELGRAYNF